MSNINVKNLSTGSISTNPPTARVNIFTNPMSDAYNGLSFLGSEVGQESNHIFTDNGYNCFHFFPSFNIYVFNPIELSIMYSILTQGNLSAKYFLLILLFPTMFENDSFLEQK